MIEIPLSVFKVNPGKYMEGEVTVTKNGKPFAQVIPARVHQAAVSSNVKSVRAMVQVLSELLWPVDGGPEIKGEAPGSGMLLREVISHGLPQVIIDGLQNYKASTITRWHVLSFARSSNNRVLESLVMALDELNGFWVPFDVAASGEYSGSTDSAVISQASHEGLPVIELAD